MKVLVVHSYYQQPGGEDAVFADETRLLREHGHQVLTYTAHNADLSRKGALEQAATALWNRGASAELRRLCEAERPDVAHFHNTFPLVSPAAYYGVASAGVPVVQTLHNYRLVCPNALLFRDGAPCEDCLGKAVPWPAIVHACYRDSRSASGVVALMLAGHRALGTWSRHVTVYVTPSEFTRQKLIEGGVAAANIVVKPNFVAPDPGLGAGDGSYALFVGRLTAEKGVRTLLRAWAQLGKALPLRMVGDGPLADEVAEAAAMGGGVQWLGKQPSEEVYRLLRGATCLVFPSEWYEGAPKVIVEAFATGTPVVAARIGAAAELIEDGKTGRFFAPGNADELAECIRQLLASPPALFRMRAAARRTFEERHSAERNHELLVSIYAAAIAQHAGGPNPASATT